ncbi:MAG: hypothetical protein OXE47_01525 [Gammaproteobacteria bacterium]|nr:hypothetical protein [Gammaproteobacteria bacterium]
MVAAPKVQAAVSKMVVATVKLAAGALRVSPVAAAAAGPGLVRLARAGTLPAITLKSPECSGIKHSAWVMGYDCAWLSKKIEENPHCFVGQHDEKPRRFN